VKAFEKKAKGALLVFVQESGTENVFGNNKQLLSTDFKN